MIDISDKKILFLGYGSVAKCVWNYFEKFFIYSTENIYIVDKCKCTLIGPKLEVVKKENITIQEINSCNFDEFLEKNGFKEGDVIIDLTVMSNTYYFIYKSFVLGLNYINTSIEDTSDIYIGTSIYYQQKVVNDIYNNFKKHSVIRSNILTECGQNPGLIQHYILHALNEMNKLSHKNDDYTKNTLLKVIDEYKIGTIFCSEIDNMILSDPTKKLEQDVIYNTWSVGGLLVEGFDKTELIVGGKQNNYIKPEIDKSLIFEKKTNSVPLNPANGGLIFLNDIGINNTLNSICPIINSDEKIEYTEYRGKLIHHGEIFELYKYFGEKAPFMSYVYKLNKYADISIREFMKNNIHFDAEDIQMKIKYDCNSYQVFNNINSSDKMIGHDSIGCTIFCGDEQIERIFWCGSILSDTDQNVKTEFTPTVVQVAAGLLSGLSYILEPENKNRGLFEPCDLDTKYMLEKSCPFLGKFFFQEIPIEKFSNTFSHSIEK